MQNRMLTSVGNQGDQEALREFGRRVREARERAGLSRDALAALIPARTDKGHLSGAAIEKWEKGNWPQLPNVLAAAEALGVSPAWLLQPIIGEVDPVSPDDLTALRAELARVLRRLPQGDNR